jgi:hypothetical protein
MAAKTPFVTRISEGDITPLDFGIPNRGDCVIGNLNPAAWAIGDWVWGDEGYKYLVNPSAFGCAGCGFHVDVIHMLLQFGAEDVPANFDVFVDLEDALWDDATGCWVPGVEDCVSPVYTVEIVEPGLYDIGIPIYDYCDCAYYWDPFTCEPYWYFLSFHFVTLFDPAMRPDAIADDFPIGCTSYNDYGAGWEDLVNTYSWPGEILIYADVFCCDDPVPQESATWGNVKNLYR